MSNIVETKQKIKEMILQDTEITKILLGAKENNYKNVKDLVRNNIFNYIKNDILSELILKDARSTFDVMDFSNVSEQTNNSDIRRRVTIIVPTE